MIDVLFDFFVDLEVGFKVELFVVGFCKLDGEVLVYGMVFLGVIFLVVGIVVGMFLFLVGVLVLFVIVFWYYLMIDCSVL